MKENGLLSKEIDRLNRKVKTVKDLEAQGNQALRNQISIYEKQSCEFDEILEEQKRESAREIRNLNAKIRRLIAGDKNSQSPAAIPTPPTSAPKAPHEKHTKRKPKESDLRESDKKRRIGDHFFPAAASASGLQDQPQDHATNGSDRFDELPGLPPLSTQDHAPLGSDPFEPLSTQDHGPLGSDPFDGLPELPPLLSQGNAPFADHTDPIGIPQQDQTVPTQTHMSQPATPTPYMPHPQQTTQVFNFNAPGIGLFYAPGFSSDSSGRTIAVSEQRLT